MLSFALSESLIIISLSLPFVKYFFKIFFKKFSLFTWLALEQPIYYITFSSLCQVLFQNFFSEVFLFPWLPQSSLYIISLLQLLVNTFSKSFFSDFFRLHSVTPQDTPNAAPAGLLFFIFETPCRSVFILYHPLRLLSTQTSSTIQRYFCTK